MILRCKLARSRIARWITLGAVALSSAASAETVADVTRSLPTAPMELDLRPLPRVEQPDTEPDAAAPDPAPLDGLRPIARPDRTANAPRPRRRVTPACSADGAYCIAPVSYTRDVCRTIEALAVEHGLDPGFFARLLWRESLFEPYAISPAGALGIAQFMPGTAALRGLDDPFNPAEAMRASAAYLRELADGFGNAGLAAAAYNGGEARLQRYLDGEGGLPRETRAYVHAITGHSVETWKRAAPAKVNYALDPDTPFETACRDRAASRRMQEFRGAPDLLPWAMIYAAHPSREVTRRRSALVEARHPAVLADSETAIVRSRLPGRSRDHWIAQTGHASRDAASRQCNRLRVSGAGCMVLRN